MTSYPTIINHFKHKHILVLGDVILDEYIRGKVSRISPEAPVPIVLQQGNAVYKPGGAANVANNLKALGAKVTLVGRIGRDAEGELLKRELRHNKITTAGLVALNRFPTSLKTRIMAQHQQVVRIDREKADDLKNEKTLEKFKSIIRKHIDQVQAVLISDYGKGLITQDLVTFVCSLALEKNKIITVDPKVEHFGFYRKVTAITPNLKETENAIRNIKITQKSGRRLAVHSDKLKTDADIDLAGRKLMQFLDLDALLITLGEQGMRLFEKKSKRCVHINTRAQDVYDVTGAGDTVISVFTLSLTAGANKHQAADLANYAAGVVVGKMGAVTISHKELLEAIRNK